MKSHTVSLPVFSAKNRKTFNMPVPERLKGVVGMIYRFRKLLATGYYFSFNVRKLFYVVQSIRALFLMVSTVAMEII